MAGHSKWANIKHKKGAQDAKRGKIFTKLAKGITIAASQGGGDPATNSSLRLALSKARAENMPNKNIERAIKRGTGEIEGGILQELVYEGYAGSGAGVIIEAVTDNKNRAVADIRHALNRYGGSMATDGAVSWQFTRKGLILVDNSEVSDQDEFFMLAAEAGADDVLFDDNAEVYCDLDSFKPVQDAIEEAGITIKEANLIYHPNSTMELEIKDGLRVMKALDKLEELDDVQNVYTNLEITDALIDAMED